LSVVSCWVIGPWSFVLGSLSFGQLQEIHATGNLSRTNPNN
jgi:hypothetical protein